MPSQSQQTSLAAKYGAALDQAVKAAAPAQPEAGFQRLPGGIRNGVARLTKCGFGQVKPGKQMAGEWYYRAEGVVIEPEMNEQGIRVAGLTTSVMIMVCETTAKSSGKTTTLAENVAAIENEMKLLGVPPESFTGAAVLEPIAAALQKTGEPGQKPIYFKFSSDYGQVSAAYPNPRVFESWHGRIENYTPPAAGRGMKDQTGAQGSYASLAPAAAGASAPPPSSPPAATASFDPGRDELADLGAAADNGDKKAEDAIFARATAAGVRDQVASAANWTEGAAIVAQAEAGSTIGSDESEPEPDADAEPEPEPEPEALWEPVAGQVAKWATKDGKGKEMKKDVEIIKAFAKKRSAYIKDLTTGKPVLGRDGKANLAVSWDVLEPA